MQELQEDPIDFKLLAFIDPPQAFPPTPYDIGSQIQSKFYNECLHFLKAERKLYECSKKIENRLAHSISDSASLDQRIKQRSSKLDKVSRQLQKINNHYVEAERREQFLGEVCKFINMQQARKILLQNKISNEEQFISKLKQIDDLSQQIKDLDSDVKIISQIKQQLSSLLQQATNKLIKGNLSESLIKKITSEYSEFFLRDSKVANIFITSLTNQRLNFFRLGLNPLINNISYVQNVAQLYQKICDEWIAMLQQQMKIFNKEGVKTQIKDITKQAMQKLITQVMPKMERGIHKVKNIVDISKIRACLQRLRGKLDQIGESTWDPLPKILMKTLLILEQKLQQGAQQLEIAKYNIYSLASYVPIRQHLELVKSAKSYDPSNTQICWQRGFKKLADSRDPSKQPNNKSLIIFNLNIWYLYSIVMKSEGEIKEKADNMIKDGIHSIVNLNTISLKKQYQQKSLAKLFDFCADIQTVKKNLNAEINLLGHEKLRAIVEQDLVKVLIQQIYTPMLKHNNLENGLTVEQSMQMCKKEKINLNKYGKSAENLRIYTAEEMKQLIS